MNRASILFHLPAHRARSLTLQGDSAEAEHAYDHHINGYLDFLRQHAQDIGLSVDCDQLDGPAPFSIEAVTADDREAALRWLRTQPDLWNWIPYP